MSSPQSLQSLINETKAAFVIAKFDGKLEVAEVIQIATVCAQKVHALLNCSTEEKKALIHLALKKGLEAAGGLSGLSDIISSNPLVLAEAERQIIDGALVAVDALMGAAPHLFAPVQKAVSSLRRYLSVCLPVCSQVAVIASIFDPKDSALIAEALTVLKGVAAVPVPEPEVKPVPEVKPEPEVKPVPVPVANPPSVESTLESVNVEKKVEVEALDSSTVILVEISESIKETLDVNIVETEPNLVASLPESHTQSVPGMVE